MRPEVKLRVADFELPSDPAKVRRFFQSIGALCHALTSLSDYGIIHGEDHRFVVFVNPIKIWVSVMFLHEGRQHQADLAVVDVKWDNEGMGGITLVSSTVFDKLQEIGVLEVTA